MANIDKFLEEKLVRYIQENMDRGIPMYRIKKALIDNGHNENIIDEALMKAENPHSIRIKHKNLIHDETLSKLTGDLRTYIKEQLYKGTRHLKTFG